LSLPATSSPGISISDAVKIFSGLSMRTSEKESLLSRDT